MSFFNELKRRNVFKVGIAYIISAWVLLQFVDLVLDNIQAPPWVMKVFMLALVVGFPLALFFAWAFEMTPEGIKKEKDVDRSQSITTKTAHKLNRTIVVVLVIALAYIGWDKWTDNAAVSNSTSNSALNSTSPSVPVATARPAVATSPGGQTINPDLTQSTDGQRPAEKSIAVLPFVNMSDDKSNDYFSEGMSEELLNLLVQVNGLRVPSRTSSFAFAGKNMDIKDIARQLNVKHVLEGSVRKSGNQVRITAQLIDVSTDTHMWSKTYDRDLDNIFAVQDEIATEIVREMKIALASSGLKSRQASQPTKDMQAYQDYLRGRHLFIQRGVPSLKASLEYLQSAVTRDPDFAEAWASLCLTAAVSIGWMPENSKANKQLALEAGKHALMLDPDSATALAGLGVLNYYQGKQAKSLELLKRASRLSRDSSPTYFYGVVLRMNGYLAKAWEMFKAAEALDPVYPQLQFALGQSAMFKNDTVAARQYFQRAIEGNNANGGLGMYDLSLQLGDLKNAIVFLQQQTNQTIAGLSKGPSQTTTDIIVAALADSSDPALRAAAIKAAVTAMDVSLLLYFSADTEIIKLFNAWLTEGDLVTLSDMLTFVWGPDASSLRQRPEFKQFLVKSGFVKLWNTAGWPDLCQPLGENDFECK